MEIPFRATKAAKFDQKVKKWRKKRCSRGGLPAVTLVINNHSVFIKRSLVRLWGLKTGYPDHKVAPWPQKRHKLVKKVKKQSFTCFSGRGPNSCFIGNQPLYFHLIIISTVLWAKKGVSRPYNSSPTIKRTWIWQIIVQNHQQNFTLCTNWGPTSFYIGNQPLCLHQMIQSIFIGSKTRFPDPNVAPCPQQRSNLVKICQQLPKKITSCSDGGSNSY